jgi:hypothetical protein
MQINGNLVFNSDGSGEILNLQIEIVSSIPTFSSSQAGRLVYLSSNQTLYYNNGAAYSALATGGNAATTATNVANIAASLGTAVDQNAGTSLGAWVGFTGTNFINAATSIANALVLLDSKINTDDALANLSDVAFTSLTSGQYLRWNGTEWSNETLVLANVTDVTATAAEVNTLHGFTGSTANLNVLSGTTASASDVNSITGYAAKSVSATEFGYLAGGTPVTSSIQDQLNNKQPLNTGLSALSTMADGVGTGIVVQTGVDTFTDRSLVAPADGFSITNADGVAGNPAFALTHNLAALAGLASTGFVTQTGTNTFTERALATGASSRVTVTNGDGVAGSPTIDLAGVTQGSSGTSFVKVNIDGYGRVSDNTAVTSSDLTGIIGSYYLPETGGSVSGNITMTAGATVTGLPAPAGSTDAVNKAYVDGIASSLNVHPSVDVLANSTATQIMSGSVYADGTTDSQGGLGVGATLTDTTSGVVLVVDSKPVDLGERVLVTGFTGASAKWNGVYVLTTSGVLGTTKWVLTRASDYNDALAAEITAGDFMFVTEGATFANSGWVQTAIGTSSTTHDAIKIGTDAISFTQFSGAGTYLAGTGLTLTGTTFAVAYGAGIGAIPSGDVGINLWSEASSALILTVDGSTRTLTDQSATLALLLPAGSGLAQDSTGLYIPSTGVTNAMLAHSAITLDVDSAGTGSIALGGTLSILGTSTQGISSAISGDVITLTVANASSYQKGVATFNTASFAVTSGDVTIKSAGISNAQLANSSVSFSGTTGGEQTLTLGGTALSIVGGSSPVTTVSAANTLTINVADATTSTLGLASFDGSQFSVTAGAVALDVTLGQGGITNVASGVDSAANKDMLSFNSGTGKWTNVTRAAMLGTESIGELDDVTLTSPAAGQTLVYSSASSKFVNRPIYFLYQAGSALTSHTVTHNIGQQFCVVTVADAAGDVIIPQSITFTDANTVTVTFTSALQATVVVMGVSAA